MPVLLDESRLNSLVENQTKFSLSNCEFSIFETHKAAFGVKLYFENLGFTGMLRGKKRMKLEDKTAYFETTKVVRFISEGVLYTITSKKADFEIKKDYLTFK